MVGTELQEAKSMVYKLQLADQLTVDVLGGGRIEHYPEQQMLSVYGYSAAFGPAPHEVTAAILQRWFPFYAPDGITISYQGY
jgi:phosphohistidine phosphatase